MGAVAEMCGLWRAWPEMAIVWRLIARLTGAFFVRQATAEAADCSAGPSAV